MGGHNVLRFSRSLGTAFVRDEKGAVIIMAALLVPVLLLASLGTTTIMMALAKKKELVAIAQAACNRGVKTLRMVENVDEDRRVRAQVLFDDLARERGLSISSREVTNDPTGVDWLRMRVQATAHIPIVPGYGNQIALKAKADEVCRGIPPYPKLNDVVLSSNFKSPGGQAVLAYGSWGVFSPQQVSWDGGTGFGVEIQDWTNGFVLLMDGVTQRLPAGVTNPYVVELDSGSMQGQTEPTYIPSCGIQRPGYNSSMYKIIELHPGTYRLSMWFRARAPRSYIIEKPIPETNTTNKVVVYLEGTKPVSAKKPVIVWDDYDAIWRRRYYDIKVDSYGLYKLHVAAEGCSDSYGGVFNDLQLKYVQRPYPEYNDPLPAAPSTN